LERLPEGDKDFSLQEDEPEMIKVRIKWSVQEAEAMRFDLRGSTKSSHVVTLWRLYQDTELILVKQMKIKRVDPRNAWNYFVGTRYQWIPVRISCSLA
jgi:hypothetical protein